MNLVTSPSSRCSLQDGSKLFSGGGDNAARAFDMNTGQNSQVGAHDGPVSSIRWIEAPTGGILATASYDKTLKVFRSDFIQFPLLTQNVQYWDLKSSTPMSTVALPERCYTMDVAYPLLVIGTAEKHIVLIKYVLKAVRILLPTHMPYFVASPILQLYTK